MLKEKKFDFTTVGSYISKWPPPNLTFVSISTSNCPSNMILVCKPMFSWSKNSMKLLYDQLFLRKLYYDPNFCK